MTLTTVEFAKKTEGKTGRIYIARNGTVTIFEMTDATYLINNVTPCGVVVNPVESYWRHSIDWQAPAYMYFLHGVKIDFNRAERSAPSLPFTPEWIEKVNTRAGI